MDTERKSSVIDEASRLEIPIVGLVDFSMPWGTYKKIVYPVPCNDSVQFVYLFCSLIAKTFFLEQKRINSGKSSSSSSSQRKIDDSSGEELKIKEHNHTNDAMKADAYLV
ncbi:hypothetical protein Ancab_028201 [Ancistrocladus abbreviatus]